MNLEPRRNTYVGHRYVPKIFGEWKRENSYEGLSIVTYEGGSYTSKQHVPFGIDIKNEKYWVLTGNYNAQIEYYRKETENVRKEVLTKADTDYVNEEDNKLKTIINEYKKSNDNNVTKLRKDISSRGINLFDAGIQEGVTYADKNTEILKELLKTENNIFIPAGKIYFNGNIELPKNATITGTGYNSELYFTDGGLVSTDGEKVSMKDFRVKREGTIGSAIDVKAGTYGWRRIIIDNVHVFGSSGAGLRLKEGWIITIINPIIQNCEKGMVIEKGTIYGASGNNINILGGELQGNTVGLEIYGVKGISLFGTCIEGNKLYGVHIKGTSRDVLFSGTYFEANGSLTGGKEVFIDTAYPDASAYNIKFIGGGFLRGQTGTGTVFDIKGGKAITIGDGISFYGYSSVTDPIIKVSENYPNHTTGYVSTVIGDFQKLMSNETLSYGKERITINNINKILKNNEVTNSYVSIPSRNYTSKRMKFDIILYTDTEGTFTITEKWLKNDNSVIRQNGDNVVLKQGYNRYSRTIDINNYDDIINVSIGRNGISSTDTLESDIVLCQLDTYIIENNQKF